jgi:hypothetical protein
MERPRDGNSAARLFFLPKASYHIGNGLLVARSPKTKVFGGSEGRRGGEREALLQKGSLSPLPHISYTFQFHKELA